ncbi:ParB/RepB/Spo0J family partition protein [Actinomyces minihominis]|uniref:ParB/RepB/Spo0J family partition protein n=1 Tax=Actinomyces minihominis TaxID=2002838 RepID=UPI000C07E0C6|nr:ParB/RepB/Spo0J family partition protein [Actinomyces minihominis]
MSEELRDPVQRARTRRPARGRSGLGQGLGALIPDTEPSEPTDSKPLDVLFPDLTGSTGKAAVKRGGSARDLLSPRGKMGSSPSAKGRKGSGGSSRVVGRGGQNVSRETLDASAEAAGFEVEDLNPRNSVDVSRETSTTVEPTPLPQDSDLVVVPGTTFGHIDPGWIIPNLKQPRQVFDENEILELSQSILEVGILQPIVVRRITEESLREPGQAERLEQALKEQPEARYELIMGERRWRAAQKAELDSVPVIVRSTGEDELLREALIENIHRVQLNVLEEAAAYSQLMDDFGYTQEQLASKVSKSRPQVANTLRLLRLPGSVQRMVAAGVLSAGHARAILGLASQAEMVQLAEKIVREGLSVRATEELVKFGRPEAATRVKRTAPVPSIEAQRVADAAAFRLETSVKVITGAKKGRLVIEFADQADLDRIAVELGLLTTDQ